MTPTPEAGDALSTYELQVIYHEWQSKPGHQTDIELMRMAIAADRARRAVPVASMYVAAHECSNCGHVGINDEHGTDAACNSCDWSGPSPTEDHCPGCGKDGTIISACPECGNRYSLLAEANLTPPIPTERVGLTEGEIVGALKAAVMAAPLYTDDREAFVLMARAIEAAHGIPAPTGDTHEQ